MASRRAAFGGLAFFPGTVAFVLVQQLAQAHAGLMQLRFGIADRAIHKSGDLVVFVALDIVQNKNRSVTRERVARTARSRLTRSTEPDNRRSGAPISFRGPLASSSGSLCLVQGCHRNRFLAQPHQHDVHGQPVQPSRKRRLSPKGTRSCGIAARRPPASGPRPRPYCRPFANTARKRAGYAADRCAQIRRRRPAVPCGSLRLRSVRRSELVSFGPPVPSGRHPDKWDAQARSVSCIGLTSVRQPQPAVRTCLRLLKYCGQKQAGRLERTAPAEACGTASALGTAPAPGPGARRGTI